MTKPTGVGRGVHRRGNGRGHGGPAQGASTAPETIQTAPPFEPGVAVNPGGKPGYRTLSREERIIRLREAQWETAFSESADIPHRDKMAARVDLLNREEGMPVARSVTMTQDEYERLNDDDLRIECERLDAALRALQGGDAAPVLPPKHDRVVN